ncbi:hypothetical protein BLX87_19645, partial [Bacillus sp. VT-16-64]
NNSAGLGGYNRVFWPKDFYPRPFLSLVFQTPWGLPKGTEQTGGLLVFFPGLRTGEGRGGEKGRTPGGPGTFKKKKKKRPKKTTYSEKKTDPHTEENYTIAAPQAHNTKSLKMRARAICIRCNKMID